MTREDLTLSFVSEWGRKNFSKKKKSAVTSYLSSAFNMTASTTAFCGSCFKRGKKKSLLVGAKRLGLKNSAPGEVNTKVQRCVAVSFGVVVNETSTGRGKKHHLAAADRLLEKAVAAFIWRSLRGALWVTPPTSPDHARKTKGSKLPNPHFFKNLCMIKYDCFILYLCRWSMN